MSGIFTVMSDYHQDKLLNKTFNKQHNSYNYLDDEAFKPQYNLYSPLIIIPYFIKVILHTKKASLDDVAIFPHISKLLTSSELAILVAVNSIDFNNIEQAILTNVNNIADNLQITLDLMDSTSIETYTKLRNHNDINTYKELRSYVFPVDKYDNNLIVAWLNSLNPVVNSVNDDTVVDNVKYIKNIIKAAIINADNIWAMIKGIDDQIPSSIVISNDSNPGYELFDGPYAIYLIINNTGLFNNIKDKYLRLMFYKDVIKYLLNKMAIGAIVADTFYVKLFKNYIKLL